MSHKETDKYFVTEIKEVPNAINNGPELSLITELQSRLLNIIIIDDLNVIVKQCKRIINETMGTTPLKGNIIYSAEQVDNQNSIEIVRFAHGGGNSQSKRKGGGVAIAVLKTVIIKGELSPVHGLTWFHEENPFSF